MLTDGPSGVVSGGSGITEPFFSNYELIWSGVSHVVYRARRYGRYYVLKGLKEELRGNALYEEWLYKEYSIGVGLDHPGIVKVLSLEDDPVVGQCIVMDWMEGLTLDHWLERRPRLRQRRRILDQLLDTVSYLHNREIYHHDLKPSNIIVTIDGNTKLIDFGLSDGPQYAVLKSAAGSEGYAAPEQRNGGSADHRADIYAIGRIVKLMFPHRYRRAVSRALNINPSRRPETIDDFRNLMRSRWWIYLLAVLALSALGVWITMPSKKKFPVELESGQTVWMRELSRFPKRQVEVVYPGDSHDYNYPEGCEPPKGDLALPPKIRHLWVEWSLARVSEHAFFLTPITSVSLPSTLRSLGNGAFVTCLSLKDTLVIPEGLEEIDDVAFNDCAKLTTVIWRARSCVWIGDELKKDPTYTPFFRCMALREAILDSCVEQTPRMLFSNIQNLQRLVLNEGVQIAGEDLAANNHNLKEVILPSTLKVIEHGAFYETGIDSIWLPDNLEVIKDYSFSYCNNLRKIRIGPNVKFVGNYAFTELKALDEVRVDRTTPPDIIPSAFFLLSPNAVLRVPKGSEDAYRNHPVWGEFGRIETF